MARSRHYSPEIRRPLVSVLYHEAKHRRVPMTTLTNQLLEQSLAGSVGWRKAQEAMLLHDQPPELPATPSTTIERRPDVIPIRSPQPAPPAARPAAGPVPVEHPASPG